MIESSISVIGYNFQNLSVIVVMKHAGLPGNPLLLFPSPEKHSLSPHKALKHPRIEVTHPVVPLVCVDEITMCIPKFGVCIPLEHCFEADLIFATCTRSHSSSFCRRKRINNVEVTCTVAKWYLYDANHVFTKKECCHATR